MSGGVDSSTVAAMLRADGHNVIGLTMQLWNQRRLAGREGMPESVQGRCCSLDDVYDARRVAQQLGIPYYVVNHEERFERDVIRPFVEEYVSGRTPIPCSLCNNHLKFDQLLIVAQQIGAERVATGHYARVAFDEERGRWLLKRPADSSKDQTYFLFGLTQEQLSQQAAMQAEASMPRNSLFDVLSTTPSASAIARLCSGFTAQPNRPSANTVALSRSLSCRSPQSGQIAAQPGH